MGSILICGEMTPSRTMEILFEDNQLLVINKPAGFITEGPAKHGRLSTADQLSDELGKQVFACHRLDKDTTGVLLFAKNKAALKAVSEQFAKRQVRKAYLACVDGEWNPSWNRIQTKIRRTSTGALENGPDGKEAITTFRRLAHWNGRSLLEALLKTGRTHQIRLHCHFKDRPVSGDGLYGQREDHQPPLALHASELRLAHPETGESMLLKAPLPFYWRDYWLKDFPRYQEFFEQELTE